MNERNVAASVRTRLLNRARETQQDFSLGLTRYAIDFTSPLRKIPCLWDALAVPDEVSFGKLQFWNILSVIYIRRCGIARRIECAGEQQPK